MRKKDKGGKTGKSIIPGWLQIRIDNNLATEKEKVLYNKLLKEGKIKGKPTNKKTCSIYACIQGCVGGCVDSDTGGCKPGTSCLFASLQS